MTTDTETSAAPEAGVYEHVSAEAYHQMDHGVLSKSRLWSMVTGIRSDGSLELSPAKLKYELEHPAPSSAAMIEGEALDTLLLEPHEFDQRYIMAESCQAPKRKGSDEICGAPGKVMVNGEWRCGTHGKGGESPPADKTVLDHIQMTQARARADSIKADPDAAYLLDEPDHPQVAMVGSIYGRAFKGRFDLFRVASDGAGEIVDLKLSHYWREHQFPRHAINMGWHVQGFAYASLGYQHDWIGSNGRIVFAVCADKPLYGSGREAPYPIRIYEMGDDLLDLGARHLRQLIETFDYCDDRGEWPIQMNAPGRQTVTVPRWLQMHEGSDEDE